MGWRTDQRLLGNIIDNAIKHANTDILIESRQNKRCCIYIHDRGPGIAPELLENANNINMDSKGLGLIISKRIAREMGIKISYLARDGGGLTVALEFV